MPADDSAFVNDKLMLIPESLLFLFISDQTNEYITAGKCHINECYLDVQFIQVYALFVYPLEKSDQP